MQMTTFVVAQDEPEHRLLIATLTWTVETRFARIPQNEMDLVIVRNVVAGLRFDKNIVYD